MNVSDEANERRALAVAQADFDARNTWTTGHRVTVTSANGGYVVSYLRLLSEGEPMIRGGGAAAGIEYHLSDAFEIERITYPR